MTVTTGQIQNMTVLAYLIELKGSAGSFYLPAKAGFRMFFKHHTVRSFLFSFFLSWGFCRTETPEIELDQAEIISKGRVFFLLFL